MKKSEGTRRDFLRTCIAGAAVLGAGGSGEFLEAAGPNSALAKSRVVIARDPMLRGAGTTVDSQRVLDLLDHAMQALFDADHPADPWKTLVRPGDKVGLKVNAIGGRAFSSNLQLVEAVCERLQQAGVKANDIVVWERDTDRKSTRLNS